MWDHGVVAILGHLPSVQTLHDVNDLTHLEALTGSQELGYCVLSIPTSLLW